MSDHVKETAKFKRAIAFVRGLDRKTFDMEQYGESPKDAENGTCGFVGCALGWMAAGKKFRGLDLIRDRELERENKMLSSTPPINMFTIRYARKKYFEAAEKLFGLSNEAAGFLFGSDWSRHDPKRRKATPARVAQRMEKFLKDGKLPYSITSETWL